MGSKIMRRRRESGFSLIELMVALSIFAVLAAVAIPGFRAWMPNYRLKSAATDLYTNMQMVRSSAIRQGVNSGLTFSAGPDQYQYDDPHDPAVMVTVILADDYSSSVEFGGPGGESFTSPITFNSRGLSNAGYAYLTNTNETGHYRVGPLTSGVVRLQKWNGVAWE